MKIFHSFALLLLLCLTASAASPNIQVIVSDFTLDFSTPARVVRITPTTGGTAQRGVSDADGQATFTSVSPGRWTLTIENVGVPALTLLVPSSSETISASTIVVSQWTPPVRTTGSITPDNIIASGYLSLSGKTNRLTVAEGSLKLDGATIGGDMVFTNENQRLHNIDQSENTFYMDLPNGFTVLSTESAANTARFTNGIEVVAIGDIFRFADGMDFSGNVDNVGSGGSLVMIGSGPLASATNGLYVVAIGEGPLDLVDWASRTVAIGAGGSETGGVSRCTFIGHNANGGTGNCINRTSIGFNATCTTDNTIVLGDGNVTAVKTAGTFSTSAGFAANVQNTANPGLKATGTNNAVLTAADGGTWILRVGADGSLSTVTNTSGL